MNSNDDRRTVDILRKLQEILDINPASVEQLEAFRTEMRRSGGISSSKDDETPQKLTPKKAIDQGLDTWRAKTEGKYPDSVYYEEQAKLANITPELTSKLKKDKIKVRAISPSDYDSLAFDEKKKYLQDTGLKSQLQYADGRHCSRITESTMGKTNHKELVEAYFSSNRSGGGRNSGYGLTGRGLTKSRIRVEGKVEKPARYIPFGRYVINKHKLGDNILMIKTPRGAVIPEMPSHHISSKLSNVFKTVAGGGIPQYDDIDTLKEEDKEHFVKVLKRCHIDRVSLPKQKSEPDTDKFDVLKGEILAGNNNPKLIKEFKVMLMKYIHAGRIPRREGHEILTDLASMGY
jgi:hypothetical protein